MKWAAVLSINLGIVNLLPLPALDGGRLLFFAVEGIRGKQIDRQKRRHCSFYRFCFINAADARCNVERYSKVLFIRYTLSEGYSLADYMKIAAWSALKKI